MVDTDMVEMDSKDMDRDNTVVYTLRNLLYEEPIKLPNNPPKNGPPKLPIKGPLKPPKPGFL